MKAELCFCVLPCVKQPQKDKSQVYENICINPLVMEAWDSVKTLFPGWTIQILSYIDLGG